jgi:hypothetical protein
MRHSSQRIQGARAFSNGRDTEDQGTTRNTKARSSEDHAGMQCSLDSVELVHFALEIIELPVMYLQ